MANKKKNYPTCFSQLVAVFIVLVLYGLNQCWWGADSAKCGLILALMSSVFCRMLPLGVWQVPLALGMTTKVWAQTSPWRSPTKMRRWLRLNLPWTFVWRLQLRESSSCLRCTWMCCKVDIEISFVGYFLGIYFYNLLFIDQCCCFLW